MWRWLKSKLRLPRNAKAEEAAAQARTASYLQDGATPKQWLRTAWAGGEFYEPPPSDAWSQIEALEERYGIRIPEDFRDYLGDVAPNEDFMDDIGVTWWSIKNIKNIPDECPTSPGDINPLIEEESDKYLIFSDFLIWCYAWAICCSEGENRGKIALIGGSPDCFVADDFRQFVALELADSITIHTSHN
ncbi:SMI1/KNR4 family protein [Sphingobium sp. DN12]|uniref:SMI1/KNR4 family protein n=1 Tax=Sphingobium sp. DN12 TaxID=3378073 RepID=UPI003DA65E53